MGRVTKPKPTHRQPVGASDAVGTAELRANLAKYLARASAGRPVIIQDRGRRAFIISKLEEEAPRSVFGCMRERTEYVAGAVVNAGEPWRAGAMP